MGRLPCAQKERRSARGLASAPARWRLKRITPACVIALQAAWLLGKTSFSPALAGSRLPKGPQFASVPLDADTPPLCTCAAPNNGVGSWLLALGEIRDNPGATTAEGGCATRACRGWRMRGMERPARD